MPSEIRGEDNFNSSAAIPVGGLLAVWSDLVGAVEPSPDFYIKLSAGEGGVGQFNEGKLTTESVSGTSPYVSATAVISIPDSPLDGQQIRPINTERRFLRASNSMIVQEDSFKSHDHGIANLRSANSSLAVGTGGTSRHVGNTQISSTNSTGGDETRPRNIGITYYLRVR